MDGDIIGLERFNQNIDRLPYTMQRTVIVRALRQAAEPIRVRAQELAPDDPTTPGSRIKENMMTQVSDATIDGATALIGPSRKGFVGEFAEWGTSHQAAEPFLRPAYDEQREEAIRILGEGLASEIEKELSR
jgi:HK97 gp10 family phage protein